MKTILTTTILSIICAFSLNAQSLQPTEFAQPTKGDYIIGGTLGFNYVNSPNLGLKNRGLNFSIAPSFGKFLSEKYLFTSGLNYRYSDSYYESPISESVSAISNELGLRFGITRFYPIVDKLYFTLGAYVGASIESRENLSYGTKSKRNYTNATFGVSPGLTYFLNNRWMINSSMGAFTYTLSNSSGLNTHTIKADLSANSFRLGVSYIFKGK